MGKPIGWVVELAVKPGRLDSFRRLTAEMVEATRRDAGVLAYQRFVSDDGRLVHACERYADADAALAHLQKFAEEFGERFLGMVERVRFTVYGTPSEALRRLLDGFGAVYLKPFGELPYWP